MTTGRAMAASVSYDVVCAGPVTLDITLAGLDELPQPGQERFGSELIFSPGAFGTIAVGAARLGLKAAVVAPKPRDLAGAYLAAALVQEAVEWLGAETERAAVTLVMPAAGERALASYDPGESVDRSLLASVSTHAVVCGIGEVPSAPDGARVYVIGGDDPAALRKLDRVRALLANEAEAVALTGAASAEEAARRLAGAAEIGIVTRGGAGAIACETGELADAGAPRANVVDTTGAGDLFAAAFVWADLRGLALREALDWAVVAATLSVARVGVLASAPRLSELEAARERRSA